MVAQVRDVHHHQRPARLPQNEALHQPKDPAPAAHCGEHCLNSRLPAGPGETIRTGRRRLEGFAADSRLFDRPLAVLSLCWLRRRLVSRPENRGRFQAEWLDQIFFSKVERQVRKGTEGDGPAVCARSEQGPHSAVGRVGSPAR